MKLKKEKGNNKTWKKKKNIIEYIKDDIHNGYYPIGYFDTIEAWEPEYKENKPRYLICTVSDKKYAKHYIRKGWAKNKIEQIYYFTKNLYYYYPYDDKTYKYKFEVVAE